VVGGKKSHSWLAKLTYLAVLEHADARVGRAQVNTDSRHDQRLEKSVSFGEERKESERSGVAGK
jgi:hypothetical protein